MRKGFGRARFLALILSTVSVAGGYARSAAAAPAPGPSEVPTVSELVVTASKTVSELTVTAKIKCLKPDASPSRATRPKVVSSFPARGEVVRPGLLVVRVTFDQPMACEGLFTAAPPLRNPCPGDTQDMLLSLDRKTVRTVCLVAPGTEYGLWVTQDPTARTFVGLGGLPSESYRLSFATSSDAVVTSVCDAMIEDEETARQLRRRHDPACPGDAPASDG
jgi:hypothetical protein